MGDMPLFAAAAEKGEFWAENRKDEKAIVRQYAQNIGFIGRPLRLSLMMEAPVVQNDIKDNFRSRHVEDIGCSENDVLGVLSFGKALCTFQG